MSCGFERVPATAHLYADCLDTSCNNENCEYEREAAEDHAYDGCFDVECNNDGCTVTRVIEDNAHSFTNSHDGDCNNDGCSFRRATSHTPGAEATCTAPQTCTVCNEELAAALGHKYDNACDEACNVCAAERTASEHADGDENGLCDVFGSELENDKGLSGGAIAAIVIGSVAAVGLGGFSLFWFVIRKKKIG